MKKLIILLALIFTTSCAGSVKFKSGECFAPPMGTLLPVEVIDGILSGEPLFNNLQNWLTVWKWIDEVKAKCGIKTLEEVADATGLSLEKLDRFIKKAESKRKFYLETGRVE